MECAPIVGTTHDGTLTWRVSHARNLHISHAKAITIIFARRRSVKHVVEPCDVSVSSYLLAVFKYNAGIRSLLFMAWPSPSYFSICEHVPLAYFTRYIMHASIYFSYPQRNSVTRQVLVLEPPQQSPLTVLLVNGVNGLIVGGPAGPKRVRFW